jgi:hypothetical protein
MSYAEDTTATFTDTLGTLEHVLSRAQAAGMEDSMLGVKLADDMFPLETQVRIAVNQIILALGRVCGTDIPLDEAPYATLDEARARVAAVSAAVVAAKDAKWADAEDQVDFTLPNGMRFVMTAEEYVRDWTLPNLYFHVTMTYALLRREGLPLGKFDYMKHMARHARPSAD